MESYNLMRHFMSDSLSLHSYMEGKVVGCKEIIRNLVNCAHNSNSFTPDHFYETWYLKSIQEARCGKMPALPEYFTKLLPTFANVYLEFDNNKEICVKDGMWNEWQMVARDFSPSFLKTVFVWRKYKENNLLDYDTIIEQNFKYTCLPNSGNDVIRKERGVLSDVHVHAGSSLEADIVWLHLLYDAGYFIKERTKWDDTFAVLDKVKTRMDIYELVLLGRQLINTIYDSLNKRGGAIQKDTKETQEELLWHINNSKKPLYGNIISEWFQKGNSLQKEANMILKALDSIHRNQMAMFLHYYLLVKGMVRQILSVQSSQYGLLQFNQTLHAPFRGAAMDYLNYSLKQMVGNDLKGAKNIELRVNSTHLKNLETIKNAVADLNQHQDNDKTAISIVCHFIKSKRIDVEKQYSSIKSQLRSLVGIDVAGNDFEVNPGTFASVFKRLHNESYGKHLHYTYHAGEDFFHILDGLRVIYEAVEFLELGEHDRIGHASAAGVNPSLWANNLNGCLPIELGKYLDDLLFASYLYKTKKTSMMLSIKTKRKLLQTIHQLSDQLEHPMKNKDDIEKWWKGRKGDGLLKENENKYKKIIEVECFDVFSADELILFQKEILKRLKDKGVAIETTPTSNVTIGHHHTFRTYHLLTWLKWKQVGEDIPDIVLGSDETGVFPTNIANEYANVLDLLSKDEDIVDAKAEVKRIIEMSEIRAFKNEKSYGVIGGKNHFIKK